MSGREWRLELKAIWLQSRGSASSPFAYETDKLWEGEGGVVWNEPSWGVPLSCMSWSWVSRWRRHLCSPEGIFPQDLGPRWASRKALWLKMLNKSDPVLPFLDDQKTPIPSLFYPWDTESRLQLSAFSLEPSVHHLYCFWQGVYGVLWINAVILNY